MDSSVLVSCEQEQLHLSGSIQPHGALLALDAGGVVTHASDNIAAYLDAGPSELLNEHWSCEWLQDVARVPNSAGAQLRISARRGGHPDELLDVVLTRLSSGGIVAEFSTALPTRPPRIAAGAAADAGQLLETLREHLPHERLLYYEFRYDGDGEVTAEVRSREDMGSYLGLRFPASDIPQVARRLYMKNPWRLIPDARLTPVPVRSSTGEPLDLSWSDLRSVSPFHATYLANMDVVGSLSFPVLLRDGLDALVACHHSRRLEVPSGVLRWARQVVDMFTLGLRHKTAEANIRLIDAARWRWGPIVETILHHERPNDWALLESSLKEMFGADFVAVSLDGTWTASDGIEHDLLIPVRAWAERQSTRVTCTDCMHKTGIRVESPACGVFAVNFTRRNATDWLLLFRAELIQEVAWGGAPEKPAGLSDGVLRLDPRSSFERWVETRRGHCRPWTNETELLALQLRAKLQQAIAERFTPTSDGRGRYP